MAGPAIFVEEDDEALLYGLMVILNSSVARAILDALNPSLHTQVRDLRRLPVPDTETIRTFESVGRRLVQLVRDDETADVLRDAEHEADLAVCALYGAPQMVAPIESRPLHHTIRERSSSPK